MDLPFLLSLIAGISGLILAWRTHLIQSRSSALDDIDQIRQALIEENQRLHKKDEFLKRQLDDEMLHRIVLEDRLDRERRFFNEKIKALEMELRELKQSQFT